MANLILIRHGQSQWNEKGLWTGLTDIGLTEKGREEARVCGKQNQRDGDWFCFYVRLKSGHRQTLEEIKGVLGIDVPTVQNKPWMKEITEFLPEKNKWGN